MSGRSASCEVVVIGAGHNGLVAATLLARAGRRVVALERRDAVGGLAAGEEIHPGYRTAGLLHDTARLRPAVVEALDLERHGLVLGDAPPAVLVPTAAGRGLMLAHDPSAAAAEIATLSIADAERYRAYRGFLGRIGPFLRRLFDAAPPALDGGVRDALALAARGWGLRRLGRRDMTELLRIGPMPAADWLAEWFESDTLRAALAAPALAGSFTGPRSPGTTAALVRWETLAARPVAGGPQKLVDALEAAARSAGVEIRTGAAVTSIRVDGGAVQGVTLAGGETIDAPIVAASCDPRRTLLDLVGGRRLEPALEHRAEAYRARGTTARVCLALDRPLRFACRPDAEVEHARIGDRLDDLERAFDAVKYGRFSETPALDVWVPSVGDASRAPAGHAVVSMLVHFAPHDLRGGWDDERRAALGDAAVASLARYAPDVTSSIVHRVVRTPADLAEEHGLTNGHVHHGEHALDQMIVRPFPGCARYRTPIDGLVLCGSGSHPGGGITGGPGLLAAREVLAG
jgi:phytoene dehydrogenase-like protein